MCMLSSFVCRYTHIYVVYNQRNEKLANEKNWTLLSRIIVTVACCKELVSKRARKKSQKLIRIMCEGSD